MTDHDETGKIIDITNRLSQRRDFEAGVREFDVAAERMQADVPVVQEMVSALKRIAADNGLVIADQDMESIIEQLATGLAWRGRPTEEPDAS